MKSIILLATLLHCFVISQGQDLLKTIKERGTIYVGVNEKSAPFGYRENGTLKGVDIDVAMEIANQLGVKAHIEPIEGAKYRELYLKQNLTTRRDLNGFKMDIIIAIYSKRVDRDVTFSIPYYYREKSLGLLVLKDSLITDISSFLTICQRESGKACFGYAGSTNASKYFDRNFRDVPNIRSANELNQEVVWEKFNERHVLGVLDDITLLEKRVNDEPNKYQLVPIIDDNPADSYSVGLPNNQENLEKAINDIILNLERSSFVNRSRIKHMEPPRKYDVLVVIIFFGLVGAIVVIWSVPTKKPDSLRPDKEDSDKEKAEERDQGPSILPRVDPPIIEKGNSYAWLIGINKYDSPALNNLEYCIKHIKDFGAILQSKYQYDDDDIEISENATFDQIILGLDELRSGISKSEEKSIKFCDRLEENDSLIIYFSGHGEYDEGIGYWIPSDATNLSKYVRNSTIKEDISILSEKIKHILIIADCCFSGSLLSQSKSDSSVFENSPNLIRHIEGFSKKKSVHVITSGEQEEVLDDNEFAKSLNSILSDEDAPPIITGAELFQKIQNHIIKYPNPLPSPQFGVLKDAHHTGGQYLFWNDKQLPDKINEYQNSQSELELSFLKHLKNYRSTFFTLEEITISFKLDQDEINALVNSLEKKGYINEVSDQIGALAGNHKVWMIIKEKIK